MVNVMFVCLGNICRSPAAHAVFRNLVQESGLEQQIQVSSSGTGSWHIGNPPDPRMLSALSKRDIKAQDLRAELITADEIARSDIVLAMDVNNFDNLIEMAKEHDRQKIHMFLEFASDCEGVNEVPDPFYASDSTFDTVIDLVEDASEGLLAYLKSRYDFNG